MIKYNNKKEISIGDRVRFIKALNYRTWYDDKIQTIKYNFDGLISVTTSYCNNINCHVEPDNTVLVNYTNVRKLTVSELREIELIKLLD